MKEDFEMSVVVVQGISKGRASQTESHQSKSAEVSKSLCVWRAAGVVEFGFRGEVGGPGVWGLGHNPVGYWEWESVNRVAGRKFKHLY